MYDAHLLVILHGSTLIRPIAAVAQTGKKRRSRLRDGG
jgi:hypothetical protein